MAAVAFAALAVGCADSEESSNNTSNQQNNGDSASACVRACEVLAPCVGITEDACQSKCSLLPSQVLECTANASSCQAADQCAQTETPETDMGQTDMSSSNNTDNNADNNNANPDPCSRCGDKQVCVLDLANESKVCKDTVQSCNETLFPDVCDCLMDSPFGGASVEGGQLCPRNGVVRCGIRNAPGATYLQVDCRR